VAEGYEPKKKKNLNGGVRLHVIAGGEDDVLLNGGEGGD